jgi:S-adenosylmethionine hydrolase
MKAVVHAAAPACAVVDLTHSIQPHAVAQASYVLDTVFDFFPAGTVFLAVVDPGVGGRRDNLLVEAGDRFVVGPDNGITTEILARAIPRSCFVIDDHKLAPYRVAPPRGRTFLGRDVFAPAAAALAAGAPPASLASPATVDPATLAIPPVHISPGKITAVVRCHDDFGNLLTAITAEHLRAAFGDADPASVAATVDGTDLGTLCRYYSERPAGTMVALVNSWDRVEVSVCEGRAADRFPERPPDGLVVELRTAAGR